MVSFRGNVMKVSLIDYTGAGSADPWYAARLLAYTKNTRLGQGEATRASFAEMDEDDLKKELDYIAGTIRSSWEFVDYTFEIQAVTRAFTHQLVRTRTASYAQEAQRVVDMSDFKALKPDTVIEIDTAHESGFSAWDRLMEMIAETYSYYSDQGVPNQDCRGVLPTNVYTNIIVKMNLRTLADLLAKRKNLRAQGEYGSVAKEIERLVLDIHPWTKPFLDPERTRTPALDAILARLLGSASPIDKPELNAALKELDTLKATWG
jgi:flavin-dependent thymidylate synthase